MLVAEKITKRFSGLVALDEVDMHFDRGEVVGLVGPNGSGKSTLLNVLSGFERLDKGRVVFRQVDVSGKPPSAVAVLGLRRTFQLPALPTGLSVMELMLTGAHLPSGRSPIQSLCLRRRVLKEERRATERARELLIELGLDSLSDSPAGILSGGQQKLLSLGAVLMSEPDVLLLDEPTAGVNPTLRHELVERLRAVNQNGTTLVIVEHDMEFVQALCTRVYVLDKGTVIACSAPAALVHNPRVVEAYLGSTRFRGARSPQMHTRSGGASDPGLL